MIAPRDRRQVLALLLSSASSLVARPAGAQSLSDRGIGGTGVVPNDASDRGIGGTGVIGTIRKFGSIYVNDMRIAYASDVVVRIDGQPAGAADLRIGQVVRVAATGGEGKLSTRTIDVTSEVVGPVDSVGKSSIKVLGQTVVTTGLKTSGLKAGDLVAVSGLRRPDGSIAASLIERSPGASPRLAGPLVRGRDGTLRIAGQAVAGVDPSLVDHRVILDGTRAGSDFVATRAVAEASLFPSDVRDVSIESYVERRGAAFRLGSGFAIEGTAPDVPQGRAVRAVLHAEIGRDGRFSIASARIGGRVFDSPGPLGGRVGHPETGGSGRPGGAEPRGVGRGPGAGAPGGFGPGGFDGPPSNGGNGFNNPGGGFNGPGGAGGANGFGGGFGGPGGGFRGGGPGGGGRH